MKENERKFWSELVATANPGWSIAVDPIWGENNIQFADLKVNIYVFDTETLWKAACATSVKDMRSAREMLEKSGPRRKAIVDASTSLLAHAADAKATVGGALAKQALLLAMAYLTDTRTFEVVQDAMGGLEGHWLVVLYRLNDGTLLTRPAFVENRAGHPLLDPVELENWVQEVARSDTTNTGTMVYKTIASSGGAKLSVAFG